MLKLDKREYKKQQHNVKACYAGEKQQQHNVKARYAGEKQQQHNVKACYAGVSAIGTRGRFQQSNRHSTTSSRQTEYHEALPSSVSVQSHLTSSFDNDGNASWYSVCRVPIVEWRLDCENCRHLTVVGLHDTGPWLLSRCWANVSYHQPPTQFWRSWPFSACQSTARCKWGALYRVT